MGFCKLEQVIPLADERMSGCVGGVALQPCSRVRVCAFVYLSTRRFTVNR